LYQDEIVQITQSTLVKISASSISIVLDSLLTLLGDLAKPYLAAVSHPPHVVLSELYVLGLIADCCSSHWTAVSTALSPNGFGRALPSSQRARLPLPEPLEDALVSRIFDAIKLLFEPIPEGYSLPANSILDESSTKHIAMEIVDESNGTPSSSSPDGTSESGALLQAHRHEIESQVQTITEYVTASSWPAAFSYFRNAIHNTRTVVPAQGASIPITAAAEDERAALVVLRLVSSFWVDCQKLSLVIQEFCSGFLHFRKSFQNTVAVVAPLLITRWLDRFPDEFVQLHTLQKRRDSGPDTLFDMTQTVADSARRKSLLYPMQTTLLFLLPEVFEVASNLREAKGGIMTKKVIFLDGLRKALRNRNEQAAYCLVSLLRAARHFDAESDSALMSYTMDVQHEVRDAVFRRISPGVDGVAFEQDVMTAAFVGLADLNFEGCVANLVQTCLMPSAPNTFKISVIQACSYFARLNSQRYQPLFTSASAFIQGQLKVST
jgi:neurofibromin 1